MKYSLEYRYKGSRRLYGDGYVYNDLSYAYETAKSKYETGQYAAVRIVEHGKTKIMAQFPEKK